MDERPKSSSRRLQLLWWIFILLELAAYQIARYKFDTNILPYLVGLNVLIFLVRIKKEPIFPSRWGFRMALLGIVAAIPLWFLLEFQHIQSKGSEGFLEASYATKGYVRQVCLEIFQRLGARIQPPHELYQWRETGHWDKQPEFSKSTLAWFTWDATNHNFSYHPVDSLSRDLHVFDTRFAAALDSLSDRQGIFISRKYEERGGEYWIKGKMFSGEPRFVGIVMDLEKYNQEDIPEILTFAQENFPSLKFFTSEKVNHGESKTGYTSLTLRLKDQDGKVLAQIGSPGEYATRPVNKQHGFTMTYPEESRPKGVKYTILEAIVPYTLTTQYQNIYKNFFLLIVMVLVMAMLSWARAEIQHSQTKKRLSQKEAEGTAK